MCGGEKWYLARMVSGKYHIKECFPFTLTDDPSIFTVSTVADPPTPATTRGKTALIANTVQVVKPDGATSLSVKC